MANQDAIAAQQMIEAFDNMTAITVENDPSHGKGFYILNTPEFKIEFSFLAFQLSAAIDDEKSALLLKEALERCEELGIAKDVTFREVKWSDGTTGFFNLRASFIH